MSQKLNLEIAGLFTDPNTLLSVPKGALAVADNLVIDALNLGESRRGQKQYNDPLTDPKSDYFYQDIQLVHDDDELVSDDGSGGWDPYTGDFTQAIGRVKSAQQNQNIYFATGEGIQKLSAVDGDLQRAGVSPALDGTAVTSGSSGWMPDDSAVAYRIVWGTIDENNNLLLGAPSARIIATNTTGSDDTVDLEFTVPSDLTTDYFYQVYRSTATVAAIDTPPEDEQLVIQLNLSSAQVTAGVVQVTDATAEDQKGAFLYTNPTQEGILQSNYRPPYATDICSFRNFMFYFNTRRPEQFTLTFLVNASNGDTIDVDGVTYTAAAMETIAADEFLAGATITETLESFIRVLNRSTNNTTVYAYQIDDATVSLEARDVVTTSFVVDASVPANFSQPLPGDSVADTKLNGISISKNGIPEAVPLLNNLFAGSAALAIGRGIPTQDCIILLKKDGAYRITGTDLTNFSVDPLDLTVAFSAIDTAVGFDNHVVAAVETGVSAFSVNGATDLTKDNIKKTLLPIFQFTDYPTLAFGINYDSDEKYFIALPSTALDDVCTQMYVYNAVTKSWTRRPGSFLGGIVGSDDLLYLIRATDQQVTQERKAFDLTDYADDEFDVTVTSIGTDAETLVLASVTDVVVGMTIKQGDSEAVITAIDTLTITLDPPLLPWSAAAATVYTPIPVVIQWIENSLQNPGVTKHANEITLFFKDARFNEILLRISTNFSSGFVDTTLESQGHGNWGEFPWGEEEWGGGVGGEQPLRTYFPKETTYAHWFSVRLELMQSFCALSSMGASIIYDVVSPRFR